jgi:PAS domain-containing protein
MAQLYRDDDKIVMESNTPKLNFEEPLETPDGKKHWVKTNKVPLHDMDMNVIGILGTYEDITEKKQTEEAFQHERLLLRTLIDNIPDGIYVKDRHAGKQLPHCGCTQFRQK